MSYIFKHYNLFKMKKINNNNHQCLNITTETYTGKEKSPKGYGFSAIGYEIGHEKEGIDKQIWVVQIKNGKKVWYKKDGIPKITHEEPLITTDTNIDTNEQITEIKPVTLIENNKVTVITKKTETTDKKPNDYQLFYNHYSTKLKAENNEVKKEDKKTPTQIKDETIAEWNRIKKNKKELEEILKIIKK